MRVALYHPWIYLKGGVERTILALVTRSRHDWSILTSHFEPEATFPEFRHLEVAQLSPVSVRRDVGSVGSTCLRLLLAKPDLRPYGALMISCEGVGNLLAFRAHDIPLLCFCHTPLKVAHDPHTHRRWLEMQRPSLLTRGAVGLFTLADRWAWRRYRRIFCNSGETRRRLLRARLARPERIEVVHPGVDTERLMPSGRREPYVLLPGRIMWTKNVELGLAAFRAFKASRPADDPFRLVIAGMLDAKSQPYLARLQQLAGEDGAVDFVIAPADAELYDLYDGCYAVLFPSLNEDWGIVPLEAMAFGKPVIAVGRGGPAESIVHGESGFLCEEAPAAFAAAMAQLVADPDLYRRMSLAARERAERFHWRHFVRQIDDYLDSLAAEGHPPRGMP